MAMAQVLERTGATAQDAPELLALAAGSPGALIDHRRSLAGLPEELVQRLDSLPATPMEALGLARDLCEALDGEQQLWLIGWWQHRLWRSGRTARTQDQAPGHAARPAAFVRSAAIGLGGGVTRPHAIRLLKGANGDQAEARSPCCLRSSRAMATTS